MYLTLEEFDSLSNPTINTWHCPSCTAKFLPFSELSDIDLIINNSNTLNNCESILNNSPNTQFQELIDNMSLQNYDVDDDNGELLSTSIHSKYYSIDDTNTIKADPTSSFNIIHTNISSIDKHFDELSLTLLDVKFDLTGITGHKIKKDIEPLKNIDLHGYSPFLYQPTDTPMVELDFISTII